MIFEKDNPTDKSRIITDEGLDRVHESLVHAAGLAKEAGFDGVDIKCCHRYLNSELLSPSRERAATAGALKTAQDFSEKASGIRFPFAETALR